MFSGNYSAASDSTAVRRASPTDSKCRRYRGKETKLAWPSRKAQVQRVGQLTPCGQFVHLLLAIPGFVLICKVFRAECFACSRETIWPLRIRRGNRHGRPGNATQNQHAEALARGQAPQKHPFATSDNVSYVRFGVGFCLGFRGFLFFAVPVRVSVCDYPACRPVDAGPIRLLRQDSV